MQQILPPAPTTGHRHGRPSNTRHKIQPAHVDMIAPRQQFSLPVFPTFASCPVQFVLSEIQTLLLNFPKHAGTNIPSNFFDTNDPMRPPTTEASWRQHCATGPPTLFSSGWHPATVQISHRLTPSTHGNIGTLGYTSGCDGLRGASCQYG